jgi:hypothetical protein
MPKEDTEGADVAENPVLKMAYHLRNVGNHVPDYTVSSQTLVIETSIMKERELNTKTVHIILRKVGNSLLHCTRNIPEVSRRLPA